MFLVFLGQPNLIFGAPIGAPITGILVTPAIGTIPIGASQELVASQLDSAIPVDFNPALIWASNDNTIATVLPTGPMAGTVTGVAPGTVTITVTVDNSGTTYIGTATITVAANSVSNSVLVTPTTTDTVAVGRMIGFNATPISSVHPTWDPMIMPLTWTSSNTSVATVYASNGGAMGVAPGTATITATSSLINGVTYTGSITITVTPAGSFTFTSTAGPNGAISPLGTITVPDTPGTGKIYDTFPNVGFLLDTVLIDGVAISHPYCAAHAVGDKCSFFVSANANHTIDVTFSPTSYSINATAGANGTITSAGSSVIAPNANKTYTITPNTNYSVVDVLIDGVSVGAVTTYTFTNVTANHTISATFGVPAYTSLVSGWNLKGWIDSTPTTAQAFGSSLVGVNVISKFDSTTQSWVSHIIGFPLNNFTINQGDGIFIHKL